MGRGSIRARAPCRPVSAIVPPWPNHAMVGSSATVTDSDRRSAGAGWRRSTRRPTSGSNGWSPSSCSAPRRVGMPTLRTNSGARRWRPPSCVTRTSWRAWTPARIEDQPYLVMDLIDGEDLAHRLKRGGRLAPNVAARIGLDIARALGVAHVRGIVHRDVKPGNILLATDGRAMVTDFGSRGWPPMPRPPSPARPWARSITSVRSRRGVPRPRRPPMSMASAWSSSSR